MKIFFKCFKTILNYQNKYHKSPHHIKGADPTSLIKEKHKSV